MTASDILPLIGVLLVGGLALMLVQTRYAAWEFQLMLASFVLHVVSAFVHIWLAVDVYMTGDILTFQRVGVELSQAMRNDFLGVAPEVVRVFFQQPYKLNINVSIGGGSTQTMFALSGFFNLLCANSFYATSVACALLTMFGKVALYQAFRETFDAHYHKWLLFATMLVPSVVFWSSGIIKEGMALTGLGLLMLALVRVIVMHRYAYVIVVVGSAGFIGLFKPHLLFGAVLATGIWLYWHQAQGRGGVQIRPLYLLVGAVVGFGGILALGGVFPQFSLERVGEESAQMQFYAERAGGGSRYVIGDPNQRSLLGQLAYAPLGLFTGLYRPLIFEATNAQMLVNALETLALLIASIYAVWRRSLLGGWQYINRRPVLVFCLVLSLVLGTMTGLVSANLGTLSRYRMPTMPFFVAVVVMLAAPDPAPARVKPAPPPPVKRRPRLTPRPATRPVEAPVA